MHYEIEIKTLLGSQKAADALLAEVTRRDSSTRLVSTQHQLNHYFKDGSLYELLNIMNDLLSGEQRHAIEHIADTATSVNVRSRQKNDDVLLIIKGSVGGSAVHAHDRMELEAIVPLTIDQLDDEILEAGWQLEAKWQADRRIYETMGLTLDLFFTPGYGYMAEFERVVGSDGERTTAHDQLVTTMASLGVHELAPERLERMFAYYNEHWQEYYGTDKVFEVQ